jgi:hypothetical protein
MSYTKKSKLLPDVLEVMILNLKEKKKLLIVAHRATTSEYQGIIRKT